MFVKRTGTLVLLAVAAMFFCTPPLPAQSRTPQRAHSANLRRPAPGYLGIGVTDVSGERARALSLKDTHGVEVRRVTEDSPASKAGVRENDVVLDLNGEQVEDVEDFMQTVAQTAPGTKVTLGIWRNGTRQTLAATLTERPAGLAFGPISPNSPVPPMPPMPDSSDFPFAMGDSPRVGFEGEVLTPQLAAYFGVKQGVLVRTVNSRTPAEKAGIKAGDVVIKVDGMNVATPVEITGIVRASLKHPIPFTIVRNKKEMTVNIDLPRNVGLNDDRFDRTLFR